MTPYDEIAPIVLNEWERLLYSTEPVDQGAAEAAICDLYDLVALPRPRLVHVVRSPLEAAVCWSIQARWEEDRHHRLFEGLRLNWPHAWGSGELYEPLWRDLAAWSRRLAPIAFDTRWAGPSRTASVIERLLQEPLRQIPDLISRGEFDPSDMLRELKLTERWTSDAIATSHRLQRDLRRNAVDVLSDFGVAAGYDLLGRLGLPLLPNARVTANIVRACPAVWFHRHMAIVSQRPSAMRLDTQGQLHCADGPAIAYLDGFGIYAWHGTLVAPEVIDPGLPIDSLLSHPNAEERRVAIERLGWDKVLAANLLERIGEPVPDPGNPGAHLELYSTGIGRGRPRELILRCVNGTPTRDGTRREFMLQVPGTIQSPLEAAAWTYGLDAERYRQALRRT